VDTVIKTKLLESKTLLEQATGNTKEQFATFPDLDSELLGAVMAALDAHNTMSTQALNSDKVRAGLKDILLNYAGRGAAGQGWVGACAQSRDWARFRVSMLTIR
jgi:type I restriction enzyme, R subunit